MCAMENPITIVYSKPVNQSFCLSFMALGWFSTQDFYLHECQCFLLLWQQGKDPAGPTPHPLSPSTTSYKPYRCVEWCDGRDVMMQRRTAHRYAHRVLLGTLSNHVTISPSPFLSDSTKLQPRRCGHLGLSMKSSSLKCITLILDNTDVVKHCEIERFLRHPTVHCW